MASTLSVKDSGRGSMGELETSKQLREEKAKVIAYMRKETAGGQNWKSLLFKSGGLVNVDLKDYRRMTWEGQPKRKIS